MEGQVLTKSFLNHAASVLFVGLLCCAQAQGAVPTNTWQECGAPSVLESVPLSVDVGRDAEIGDVLGQWTRVEVVRWDCIARATIGFVLHKGARVNTFFPGASVWGTISLDGSPYTVYKIIQNGKSIGFIAKIMLSVDNISNVTTDFGGFALNQNPMVYTIHPTEIDILTNLDNGESVFYVAGLVVRLVKISNDFPLDNSSIISFPAQISLRTDRRTNATWHDAAESPPNGGVWANDSHLSWDQHASHSANVPVDILTVNTTCNFFGLSAVSLGNHSVNALLHFNEPLSYITQFFVKTVDCPKYMSAVHFSFSPMPSSPYAANGVLALVPPSTATGVGVQIFTSIWNSSTSGYEPVPLQFNAVNKISLPNLYESSSTMIGMTMYARMVRLHPSIPPSPGTVHAAMKAILLYK